MPVERIGELAALGTAVCWTITAMSFESAGKRVGSLTVNLLRLAIAFIFFSIYSMVVSGSPVPVDAPPRTWAWLAASGFVGFVIGDLLLFQAFVLIGSRVSMLIYSSVPPLTAILGWLVLHETLSPLGILGMALTVCGIAAVVLQRNRERSPQLDAVAVQVPHAPPPRDPARSDSLETAGGSSPLTVEPTDPPSLMAGQALPAPFSSHGEASAAPYAPDDGRLAGRPPVGAVAGRLPIAGVLLAFGGALGQAGGLVLSKLGAPSFDAIAATQIRSIAGLIGFALIFVVLRRWRRVGAALRDRKAMLRISIGAFFGPFVGVSAGLYAAQISTTGIASTIMSLVPIFIIVPSVLVLHEHVTMREVVGAVVAVAGVGLLFF